MVTHDDLELRLWGPNKLYDIIIFHFSLLSLCYRHNQKTGVALFDGLNMT